MKRSTNTFFVATLALLLAAIGPASAQTSPANTSASSGSEPSWLSGGVGEDSRDEMRRAASAYNVHLLFHTTGGAYLASVPFSVATANGQEIYSGVSDGPMLYLKLKPGTYQISAEIDGTRQTRRVSVGSGAPARLSFVSKMQPSDR